METDVRSDGECMNNSIIREQLVADHRRKMQECRDVHDRDTYSAQYICHSDRIPQQNAIIAYTLEDLYQLHGARQALPETDKLVRIVERAEADMREFRKVHPHGQGHPLHPKITDSAYHALKELPEEYFLNPRLMPPSKEQVLQSMEGDRRTLFALPPILAAYGSPLLAIATLPITLPLAVGYAVLPDRVRAWIQVRTSTSYAETEGKEQFARIRAHIDPVIAHYQSTQK